MMKVASITLSACLLLPIIGYPQSERTEASKADAIKRIMNEAPYHPETSGTPFCKSFVRDLSTFSEIKILEPMTRADSYDDPSLASLRMQCSDQPLNESFECVRGIGKLAKSPKARRKQYLESCDARYGTKNFKVFFLNRDVKRGRPDEILVYFEAIYIPRDVDGDTHIYSNGGYNLFTAKTCESRKSFITHDPYSYVFKRPLNSYNAIVMYHDDHFVVDLWDMDEAGREAQPAHYLSVEPINGNRSQSCAYSDLPK